jgi:hypothetical protein
MKRMAEDEGKNDSGKKENQRNQAQNPTTKALMFAKAV